MKSKEIRSKITDQAKLELSIEEIEVKKPVGSEVLIKMQFFFIKEKVCLLIRFLVDGVNGQQMAR